VSLFSGCVCATEVVIFKVSEPRFKSSRRGLPQHYRKVGLPQLRLSGDVCHSVYWNKRSKIVKVVNHMSWNAGGDVANKVRGAHRP
jgi:hypothetical protein